MRSRLVVLLVALAGCAPGWRLPWDSSPPLTSPPAELAMVAADSELAGGRTRTAVEQYDRIVRDYAGQPAAAQALHMLVVLRLDPQSGVRSRRAANAALARLAADYPETGWAREARAWQSLLRQIDRGAREVERCQSEAGRLGEDAEHLRQTLEELKDSDLELEQ